MDTPATLAHAPALAQRRYRNMAMQALKWRGPAIKLFCIECMGYSYPDAKACDTERCPLWAVSRPMFLRNQASDSAEIAMGSDIEGENDAIEAEGV